MPAPSQIPGPEWRPVPRDGCVGVDGKVLLTGDDVHVALLRFSEHATIDEHDAPDTIDVVCLEGEGFVSVGDERYPFGAGETIRWPAGAMHRLWTEATTMTTLMFSRRLSR